MSGLLFITHPQVAIEPERAIEAWELSALGKARMHVFARAQAANHITRIVSSPENKAMQSARILAETRSVKIDCDHRLAEVNRSATGYLPLAQFETVVDAAFAQPTQSVRGWESFVDAQARILAAYRDIADQYRNSPGDTALFAHGGVGTLLYCALLGVGISRDYEPPFLGHYWRADSNGTIAHGWRSLDSETPVPTKQLSYV